MEFVFQIAILILSVVVHEVSHGYAALYLGDKTAFYQGRLTLNPLRHLDPVGSFFVPLITYTLGGFILGWARPVPFNPYNLRNQRWGEAIVAAAGPLSNILLALIFGLSIRFFAPVLALPESFILVAQIVVFINLILAIFNLIPIPPLDGSKILFALLPPSLYNLRINLERFSLFLVLIFVFFLWKWLIPVVLNIFSLITGLS
jgi:Zn-dependent protease